MADNLPTTRTKMQFLCEEGDRVRVEIETGKYLDRVSDREVKGAKFTTAAPPPKEEPKGKPEDAEKPPKEKKQGP